MPAPPFPEYLAVAQVLSPHGTDGDLYLRAITDRPAATFVEGVELQVADLDSERPDPLFPPLRIETARPYRRGYLVHFEGMENRENAGLLRERVLLRPFEELEPLEEGEVFHHELVGLRVLTTDGTEVGRVREVFPLEPHDLLEVDRGGSTLLVPFSAQVVVQVEVEEGRLTIDPPEGLLDL